QRLGKGCSLDLEDSLQGLHLLACRSPHRPMLADIHRQDLVLLLQRALEFGRTTHLHRYACLASARRGVDGCAPLQLVPATPRTPGARRPRRAAHRADLARMSRALLVTFPLTCPRAAALLDVGEHAIRTFAENGVEPLCSKRLHRPANVSPHAVPLVGTYATSA